MSIEGVETLIRHDGTCHVSIEGVGPLVLSTICDESCNMSIEEVESDEALLVPVARILQFICDVMR